ncbi:DUF111 family protein [Bacillus sp. B15-48]|nr:DUF111 family protein [Bacillus sp. B15-48]
MKGVGFLNPSHPPNHEHVDEQMIKMEVNLDNMSGEWLGYVMDLLFEAGANDVYYTPIYMKKNRPAILLQLLCSVSKLSKMKEILFKETTTLGVRYYPLTVHRLARNFVDIPTKWGNVTVKEGLYEGEVIQKSPEYEECRTIAQQHRLPLKSVYEEVWEGYHHLKGEKES